MPSFLKKGIKKNSNKGKKSNGRALTRVQASPWNHRLLPREFQIALKGTITDERTGGQTTQAAVLFPLLEFNSRLPMYAPQLYQIYRFCKIRAIHIKMEVVNTSATQPLTATMCCLPLVRANAIVDPRGMADVPNAICKQVGLSTGMSRIVLNKSYISERELGQSTLSGSEYYQSYSEAISAASQDDFPSVYCGVIASSTGGNWTGIIKYVVTYDLEFTEYEDVAPSMKGSLKTKQKLVKAENERDEDEDSQASWVEPDPSSRAKMKKCLDESRARRIAK